MDRVQTVELDRIDLVVLYCVVHYREEAILSLMETRHLSRREAAAAVPRLGIAKVWGNNTFMKDPHGHELMWDYNGTARRIPDGMVNRFIVGHDLGIPLFWSSQFYRIVDNKLTPAGFLIGGQERFVPRESGMQFVSEILDHTRMMGKRGMVDPNRWPHYVPATNGTVHWEDMKPSLHNLGISRIL